MDHLLMHRQGKEGNRTCNISGLPNAISTAKAFHGLGFFGGCVCLFVCLFYPHWSAFNWETSVYGNFSKVIKMKCSAEGKPMPWASHFHREALAFWKKRNRRGFASSVAGYFAHAALFKPTGLQQSFQGFIFAYTIPSAHRKWTAHKRVGSKGASTFWRWKHWS